MTKTSKSQASEHNEQSDDKSTSTSMRKRDKIFGIFRSSKTEARAKSVAAQPEVAVPRTNSASIKAGDNHSVAHVSTASSSSGVANQRATETTKVTSEFFSANVARPTVKVAAPKFGARFDSTQQLALCSSLLPKSPVLSSSNRTSPNVNAHQAKDASQGASTDDANRDWVAAIEQNSIEQDHIGWLLARTIEEFIKDSVKGSDTVSEVILLGPVLDGGHYVKLLNCFITEFDNAPILDVDLLQGLVQLVQCASEGYLVAEDLIKILSVVRIRLQPTDQQSTEHPYHLTLAVSRLLDVMVKHEVKDLDRVEQHEPLSAVLNTLRENSDPFLMYQASYAFQALQYVPVNETPLQSLARHTGVVVEGLVGISGVVNLNLSGFLGGLDQLHKAIVDTIGTTKSAIEGARSLVAGGKGVFEAIKESVSSGHRREWYLAIVGATDLVRDGRLADFKAVVMEAVCRKSPEFQWGVCQLLGEIAVDTTWESATRREAVAFLVELYSNDPDWKTDASVRTWMLTIFYIISEDPELSIHTPAAVLQQDTDKAEAAKFAKLYPLRHRLPVPGASPLLARVQEIPLVERDLDQLRLKRQRSHDHKVYIPPQAKASLQMSDDDTKPLMDLVKEFLDSERQVFLVLGDSGAGKSTFNRHLEDELWKEYTFGGPIPLFINLPAVRGHYEDMIGRQLRIHKFPETKIKELQEHRKIILICDGYDETQLNINLHSANMLNEEGADTKMIISCRSTYLGNEYRNKFQPKHSDRYNRAAANLFTEAVIVPFSNGQIRDYIDQFVRDPEVHKLVGGGRVWTTEDYISKLRAIPYMMDLVKNPFLLSLALRALPRVVKDTVDLSEVKVTRLTLYDSFIDQWLDINKERLENLTLSADVTQALNDLLEEGFAAGAIDFLKRLAAAIFREQNGIPVVEYLPRSDKKSWKFSFFGPEPETFLLRESSPLSRTGLQHQFMHTSLLEYFFSRYIYETHATTTDHPLSQRNFVKDKSIINFLAEYVQSDLAFKRHLQHLIELSKTDKSARQAAVNAITILVCAGVTFNGADLRGIQVSGADLSGGHFDSAQLQGADLSDTNLRSIWLRQADLSHAQMAGVQFGEWPSLHEEHAVRSCAYSPDGKILAVGLKNGHLNLYKTAIWEKTHTLYGHTREVKSVMFSPSSQQIVSGSDDKTVRLWDAQTGTPGLIFSGHDSWISGVAFSPSGQQIASGGMDNMVRLWNAQTGADVSILIGHTAEVTSLMFSPSGKQVVSGSSDMTVRLWNAQTGEPGAILSGHTSYVISVAFSSSGQQIASASKDNTVWLWDAETGAPGHVLNGHTAAVRTVVFSPCGQKIASGSFDNTVRLWDALTGAPVSILSGHTSFIMCVVFSPNGQQIVSGAYDKTVRLWDAQASSPGSNPSTNTTSVWSLVFSPSGQKIVSGSSDHTLRLWDVQTGEPGAVLTGHSKDVRSVMFSPCGQKIVSGSQDKTVRLWDAQTGADGLLLTGHTSFVMSVVFSPSGRQIASGSYDKTVRLWDAQTGAVDAILSGHDDWINSVAYSPCGQRIASGSHDKTVRLWNAQTGALISALDSHTSSVMSVAFSSSGKHIVSGSNDKTVRLWDAQTGTPGAILVGHDDCVRSVVFSPGDEQIASSANDGTVRLWEVASGECLTVIKDFNRAVGTIAWFANEINSYIATGCFEQSLRLWKVTGDRHRVCLVWSSGLDQLAMTDTVISEVQGLSKTDLKLLAQLGATGNPISFDD